MKKKSVLILLITMLEVEILHKTKPAMSILELLASILI